MYQIKVYQEYVRLAEAILLRALSESVISYKLLLVTLYYQRAIIRIGGPMSESGLPYIVLYLAYYAAYACNAILLEVTSG